MTFRENHGSKIQRFEAVLDFIFKNISDAEI